MAPVSRPKTTYGSDSRDEQQDMVDEGLDGRMELPGFYSSEMMRDAYGTLRKYSGGLIRGNAAMLTHFWRAGSLVRQVAVRDSADSEETPVDRLVVCGPRSYGRGRLLGLKMQQYGSDGMTREEAESQSQARELIFVTDKASCPKWLKKSCADVTLVFDQPVLGGVYVARLSCFELDDEGSYQVLTGVAGSGAIHIDWEEATMLGKQEHGYGAPNPNGTLLMRSSGLEERFKYSGETGRALMQKRQADKDECETINRAPMAKETIDSRLGGLSDPVRPAGGKGSALTTKGRGATMMMGNMFLEEKESQDACAQNKADGKTVNQRGDSKRKYADQAGSEGAGGKDVEADAAAVAAGRPVRGAEMRTQEKNGIGQEVAECVNLPTGHLDRPAKKARKSVDQSGPHQAVSHIDPGSAET